MDKYTISDRFADAVDLAFSIVSDSFGRNPERYIDLATVDSAYTLVTNQGNLMSGIDLRGFDTLCGQEEFNYLVQEWYTFWRKRLTESGAHELHWFFEMDPDASESLLKECLAPSRRQAQRMGLDVDDLFAEKIQANIPYIHYERSTLIITTKLQALASRDRKNALEDGRRQLLMHGAPARDAQPIGQAIPALRAIHNECIDSFLDKIEAWGYSARLLTADEVLVETKSALYGRERGKHFKPDTIVTNEQCPSEKYKQAVEESIQSQQQRRPRQADPVQPSNNKVLSPRKLSTQLLDDNPESFDADRFLRVGNRFVAPVQIVRHTQRPLDFTHLIRRLKKVGIPARFCFRITPDTSEVGWGIKLASILRYTGPVNASIAHARKMLEANAELGNCNVGFVMTATTWAPAKVYVDAGTRETRADLDEIQVRVQKLMDALEDWGDIQSNQRYRDAAEIYFSTCPALITGYRVEPCPAPLLDVLGILPLLRFAPAWQSGSMIMRTEDGQLVSYAQTSGKQTTWVTAVVGPQGTGKSANMFNLNFSFVVQPSPVAALPFLRGIDFGESQSGLVDLVKAGLPRDRRHEAEFVAIKNEERFATNPFDLLLGLDEPMPEQRRFLTSYLGLMLDALNGYASKDGLIAAIVDEAYRHYRNDPHNTNVKRYEPGVEGLIDDAILAKDIVAEGYLTPWWQVRDMLFDADCVHEAELAQRRAVPILEDLAMIASSETITAEYKDSHGGLPVTELFGRGIREVLLRFRFLRGYTQFSLSHTKVGFLEMRHMLTKSERPEDQRDNAIIMFAALRMLVRDFWYTDQDLHYFHIPKYRAHAEWKFREIESLPKRFLADELHRFVKIESAADLVDEVIAEGRKNFVDVMLGTQQVNTHTETTRKLATTVLVCGTGGEEDRKILLDTYQFNDSQVQAMRSLRGPSPAGSNVVFRFRLKSGRDQVINVYITEGARKLWALATEQVDRTLRKLLYARLPQAEARRRLAIKFPSGTAKPEIESRLSRMEDEYTDEVGDSVIMDIVNELCDDKRYQRELL